MKKLAFGFVLSAAVALCAASAWAAGTLPAGYTEVQYIQGNSAKYIKTNYTPNPTTDKAEVVVEWPDSSSIIGNQAIWCARNNGNVTTWTHFLFSSKIRFDYNTTTGTQLNPEVVAGTRYTNTVDRNVITWSGSNDSQTHTADPNFTAAGGPVQLFASYTGSIGNGLGNYGKHKLYSFKVWRSGELIHYFVPCKDANDVVTMYDICDNPATLELAGSGNFTAGPEGHYYDDTLFGSWFILPIPKQICPQGATPEPGFTVTNWETGASWTFAEGGAAPGGCPFEASYSHADGVGTVTATGKAGSDYAGVTVSRSYSVSDELLVNGGFEDVIDYDSGNKVGLALNWTPSNGYGNNAIRSNSGYSPNQTTTFITGTYCAAIDVNGSLSQVFTNDVACVATLSWKCKHRTNINSTKAMFYWVLIDGEVVYPEEKTTGSDVRNRSVSGIVLAPGEHTLTFQGHSEDNVNQALFVDNVSLKVQSVSSLMILPIEDQIGTGSALTPSFVVSNTIGHATYEVGGGASSELFDVVYSNNTARGTATVTVTGKARSIYEGETTFREFRIRAHTIVRATADGTGDGSSWASPISWASALAAAAADEDIYEIWLQGDVAVSAAPASITFNGRTIVRGGFAGTESSADERSGAHSVFSANDAYDILIPNVAAGASLSFERVDFHHAKRRAVSKSGAGDISFTDCSLSFNGRTIGHNDANTYGLGLYATGGGQTTLTNCRVEGNSPTASSQYRPGGFAIRADNLARLTIDNCVFLTNGIWKATTIDGDLAALKGATLYLTGTPLTMRNSRISGSIAQAKGDGNGGIVFLEGACGGSAFTNCLFSGNLDLVKDAYSYNGGGIVVVNLDTAGAKVDVSGCTFAYNLTQSRTAGCLAIYKGDVHVTGSTFFYNVLGYRNARNYGADITVLADGRLAIDNSRLTSLTSGSITSADPSHLTMDLATMAWGNPYFNTAVLDYEALIDFGLNCGIPKAKYDYLVGIDATELAVKPVKPDLGAGSIIYVDESATGACDGTSWANAFTDLNAAIAVASPVKNEIWVKGNLSPATTPNWILIETNLVVRGGFAGTESSPADRAAGSVTTIDGANGRDFFKVSVLTGASLAFDGFVFTRAQYRVIEKRGGGDLKFVGCRFLNNGTTKSGHGRGINALGGYGAAKLVVDSCEFAGLRQNGRVSNSGCGTAIYASAHARVTCDDSLFCSNGVPILKGSLSNVADNRNVKGSVIFLAGSSITMRNSRIAANGGSSRESNSDGGIVWLDGNADGSAFTNCAFVGNYANNFKDGANNNTCGALVFKPDTATRRLDIENCTFAYNVSQANQSPGGLNVHNGDVRIRNSIFWQNIHGFHSQAGYGNDIDVKAGTVTIAHSFVTGKDSSYCRGATVDSIVMDDATVFAIDPDFVTSVDVFTNQLTYTDANYINPDTGFNFAFLGSLDVHLLSEAGYWLNDGSVGPDAAVTSLAIDKGDPSSAFANEPVPNGGRINVGAYGNTSKASKTASGQPSVEAFSVTYPDGISRPKASLTLGLGSGVGYSATVTFVCKTNGITVATGAFENCRKGDVVEWMPPYYFLPGTVLTIEYEVDASGATTCRDSAQSAAMGGLPPFYGKGGGANVIHVREGADCLQTGEDWTDAFPDVPAALAAIGPGKTEIWIAKSSTFAPGTFTLNAPLTIRGGFAGTETSPAERSGDGRCEFDFLKASSGLEFTTTASTPLVLDRIGISRAINRGLKKTGAGSLTLTNCRIADNGLDQINSGRGLHVSSGVFAATNTVFDGNYYTLDSDGPGDGGGIYLSSCTKAIFEGCLFTGNGIRYSQPNSVRTGTASGAAIYANATPTTCRNTRFAENRIGQGAVVQLNNNCDGSLFENCAFVGNSMIMHWAKGVSANTATFRVNMDQVARRVTLRNCTFAFNLNSNRTAPAGLLVVKGTAAVEDSIFWGNRRSSYLASDTAYPSAEDIEVRTDGYLSLTNVFLTATNMDTDKRHYIQTANLTHLTTNHIVTGDAMLVSMTNEVMALMVTGNANFPDLYYPSSVATQLRELNVHLRGGSGYYDENTGELVKTYREAAVGGSSPALDASTRRATYEPRPNGKYINLGYYGNTQWATMSKGGGSVYYIR